jgi:DNA-binding beta-propeller fold protein YncE
MHNSWSNDSRHFFTLDRVDKELAVIDTSEWSVREIGVSSQPHYAVPSPDGKELWLVLEGTDKDNPPEVVVYDLPDMAVKTTIRMPVEGETAIEGHHGNFTQDGKYFLLLNRGPGKALEGHKVAVYDAATKALVTEFETASTGIGHAYNAPDGRHTMVTNYGNNVVTIVDLETLKPVKDLMMGTGRMGHVAYTQDGRYGYVSNDGGGNLFKVDMQTLEPVAEIKTGGAKGGGQVLNVWTNVFEELPR